MESEPDGTKYLDSLALRDGTMSRPRPCSNPSNPTTVPAMLGFCWRVRDIQPMFSLLRAIPRVKLIPQLSLSGSKDRVLNGMAISAVHPSS